MADSISFPEPVRVVSDLHLGHPGSRIAAAAELRPLLEGAGTVLFNGDTREMLAKNYLSKGEALFAELRSLIEELGVEAHFMRGNHDPDISDVHHIDLHGRDVLITHGDVLFPEISPWGVSNRSELRQILAQAERLENEDEGKDDFESRLRRANQVCRFNAVFDKETKPGLLGHFHTVHNVVWPPRKLFSLLKCWFGTHGLAADFCAQYRPEARVMVFGHTHLPGIWELGGRTFINTGGYISWGGALMVELEGSELRVFAVRKRGGLMAPAEEPQRTIHLDRAVAATGPPK